LRGSVLTFSFVLLSFIIHRFDLAGLELGMIGFALALGIPKSFGTWVGLSVMECIGVDWVGGWLFSFHFGLKFVVLPRAFL
jgi:hypothetical protein